jgi:hypothetical protein
MISKSAAALTRADGCWTVTISSLVAAGYQTCKTIYLFHPLGGKMVDRPIKMAMNEPRTVHVAQSYSLEQRLRDAFEREWKAMGANQHIANAARIAGFTAYRQSLCWWITRSRLRLDYRTLYKHNVSFNILDPLNTAGSIVLNQDPNAAGLPESRRYPGGGQAVSQIALRGRCRTKTRFIWRTTRQHSDSPGAAFTSAPCSR